MSNYGLYIVGYVILIVGLAYGASLVGVPQTWILVGAVVLLGIGIITGVTRTRRREQSPTSPAATVERETIIERR